MWTESSSHLGDNDFNEVDEPDTSSQKKLVDTETEGVEMESSPSPVEKKKPRIFTLRLVNSYGSADFDKLVDDGVPVKFSSKASFSLESLMTITYVHFLQCYYYYYYDYIFLLI